MYWAKRSLSWCSVCFSWSRFCFIAATASVLLMLKSPLSSPLPFTERTPRSIVVRFIFTSPLLAIFLKNLKFKTNAYVRRENSMMSERERKRELPIEPFCGAYTDITL
ncbi:hypothetical protein BpHYR1_053826 [Brachionus plicatilis]|uniref:Uncharacterized protein n=1 Tax=Brachionus plicatilis TaxID=10195 RepID=A0A3M7R5K1_BRAPC|nr:hypothetical protein BpHYR1_053826 [Brachionus plicatilis]